MTTTLRGCTISFPALIAVTTAIAIHPTALGQWKVTNLHPAGATQSFANSTTGTQVVGWANVPRAVGSAMHASLWSSSADSWVDLNPADAFSSIVSYAFEGQQAGTAYLGSGPNPHAGLWSNSSASWTDLHPVGQMASSIGATSHAQQVGWTAFSFGQYHACLWSGSAASWTLLEPPTTSLSMATGISGMYQVGWVGVVRGSRHASLWSGTPASWVDLNPENATRSEATGISGMRQVGYATFGDVDHAGMWFGTAGSWVDLHPNATTGSRALATSGEYQVGYATVLGFDHASAWTDTASSWEDLSLALGGSWSDSLAQGIWSNGALVRVAGVGTNRLTGRQEALLWSRPVCCADVDDGTATGTRDGTVTIDDLLYFLSAYEAGFEGSTQVGGADLDNGMGLVPGAGGWGGTPDGAVTIDDLLFFLAHFQAGC